MGRLNTKALLRDAGNYVKAHPEELVRALRGAVGLRFGVPIDALRYLAREFGGGKKAPKDIVLEAAPPGLRASATVDAMGTPIRASLVVFVEQLEVDAQQVRVGVRIAELQLAVLGDAKSPVAGLLQSGAIDLSKPGNLINFLPKRPEALVEAKDDRLVFDLLKIPALGRDGRLAKVLSVLTPVVRLSALRTLDDHLDLHVSPSLAGLPTALSAARSCI